MGWRDFHGEIIETPTNVDTSGRTGLVFFAALLPGLFFLTMQLMPQRFPYLIYDILLVGYVIAAITTFIYYVFYKKVAADKIIGTFSLLENTIVINLKADGETDKTFGMDEIQYLNIFMGRQTRERGIDAFWENVVESRCDLYVHHTHYRFSFISKGYQQKENLGGFCIKWSKLGYKVNFIYER